MEEGYSTKWCGSFGEVHDGIAWFVRPSYDPNSRLARNDVTVFRHELGDIWNRSDFRITQKCHSESQGCEQLRHAGFAHIESYDAERDLAMMGELGRQFFLACSPCQL